MTTLERSIELELAEASAAGGAESYEAAEPPRGAAVHELVAAWAAHAPEAPALAGAGGDVVTYRELDERSGRLAAALIRRGVGPETVVGVALGRSPELVVAQLAVLRAGGAFLCLDPDYPIRRLAYQVADSRVPLVLAAAADAGRLAEAGAPVVELAAAESEAVGLEPVSTAPVSPKSLAYVIYTSGSTGEPKGAALTHGGLLNLALWHRHAYAVTPSDRATQVASPAFDASVWEIWPYLVAGASLHFPDRETRVEPARLYRWLAERGITLCFLPTPIGEALLAEVAEREVPAGLALRALLVGGERLHAPPPPGLPFRLVNHYGPTEDTVVTTAGEVPSAPAGAEPPPPPIGRPIAGTRVVVAGTDGEPAVRRAAGTESAANGDGEPGELRIGGSGLARGYLGRPAMTAARFVPDPAAGRAGVPRGARLYRSGDLVRRLASGEIAFLGRIDRQVKVRGHRIELGEIEAALLAHPRVRAAAVVARGGAGQPDGVDARLVGYVVAARGGGGAAADAGTSNGHSAASAAAVDGGSGAPALAAWLRDRLPDYMVPVAWVELDELPLTPNGKLDRDALPAPGAATPGDPAGPEPAAGGGADAARSGAANETERALAGFWRELLGVERIGPEDDFFALGGHSLLAGRLLTRVRERLGVELPLDRIYTAPTLAAQAAEVEAARAGTAASIPAAPPIGRAPRDRPLPLTFPQERVWFLSQLAPDNLAYNSQMTIRFRGPMRPDVYAAALTEIVRRHEVFRTRFPAIDGVPVQEVGPAMPVPLPLVDLRALPATRREEHAEVLVGRLLARPFDLLAPPLARWWLLRMAGEDHVLVQSEHHFVHDGWSFALLVREMRELYTAFAEGRPSPLPEPAVQCADFAWWQRSWVQGEVLERQLDYWREHLAGAPDQLELPADRPRPQAQSMRGEALRVELPDALCGALRGFGRARGSTLFNSMLAGFFALLHRVTGAGDLVVGSAFANRAQRGIEDMVGMVVNTLVLRAGVGDDPRFDELMARASVTVRGAYAHQDTPFDRVVEAVGAGRDRSRNPLFQAMFSFHDSAVPDLDFGGLSGELHERTNGSAKVDLYIVVIPRAEQRVGLDPRPGRDGITLIWEYASDLFDRTTMQRMVGAYLRLLEAAVAEPEARVSALALLSPAERHQVLLGWNDTDGAYPRDALLGELFEEWAARTPDALAVLSAAGSLSYGDLDARANRLARHLRRLGARPDVPVGLCLERCPEMVVATLAILKAGGAYLPLDPEYPAQRLEQMIEDAGVSLVVATAATAAGLPAGGPRRVLLDRVGDDLAGYGAGPLGRPPGLSADGLAYAMFTSGSTGRPKGVAVSHRNVARLVRRADFAEMGAGEVWLQYAALSFDLTTLEIWAPLLNGGRVALPPPGPASLAELGAEIERWGVTSMWLTAGLFHQMVEADVAALAPLRQLLAGGDVLSPLRVGQLLERLPATVLINGYGPTENTTFTSCHRMRRPADARPGHSVPIGRPISATTVYLLDRRLRPVPAGVVGGLYSGGDGVARGYLSRPRLTAESFLPDPWGAPGARMYRTGDLARWLPDGTLEFLGRADRQVKLRGFRIELEEIQSVLAAVPEVAECAVALREDRPGDQRLVAYVVPRESATVDAAALSAHLGERLPAYMVPAAFVPLEALPLSPNGKLDRAALPAPAAAQSEGGSRPPATPAEEILASIFARVLPVGESAAVGADDDFFRLGGHSLLATRIISRLRDAFGVELPLAALFEHPTVAGLARAVEAARRGGAEAAPIPRRAPEGPAGAAPPLSFAQERLWFLDRLVPGLRAYHIARAFTVEGPLDPAAMARALGRLIARHESLRTTFVVSGAGGGAAAGGRPVQRIAPPPARVPLPPRIDLRALPPAAAERALDRAAGAEALRCFDLERGPLLRTILVALPAAAGRQRGAVLVTIHHIVSDGWSMGVLFAELGAHYAAEAGGPRAALPPLPVQYADWAAWQRAHLTGSGAGTGVERRLAFWREHLDGAPLALELPADRPRPALQSFRGGVVIERLDPAAGAALRALAGRSAATPFLVLFGALAALLSRLTGQDDLVIGTPMAGRDWRELEGLIGLLVNTLALRVRLRPDGARPGFDELLRACRRTLLATHAHQDLPFERVVEAVAASRDLSRSPLFQVLFAMEDTEAEELGLGPGLEVAARPVERRTSHFDLTLFARAGRDGGYRLVLAYDSAIYDRSTAARTARQLGALLAAAITDPARPVDELPLMGAAERHQAVLEWNDTAAPMPEGLLHEPFRRHAAARPEAPAVVWPGGTIAYGELALEVRRLARHLRAAGVGRGSLVGVHLGRSPRLISTVLAILEAGGAYVPLEPSWPADRVRWILVTKGVRHLVVEAATAGTVAAMEPAPPVHLVSLDPVGEVPAAGALRGAGVELTSPAPLEELEPDPPAAAAGAAEPGAGPDDVAYVIFTSGSTGRPKGVMVRHRPAMNLIRWVNRTHDVGPDDRLLFVTALSFDLSVYDVFGILAAGGSIRLAGDDELRDPERLVEILVEEPITFWDSAPAALQQCAAFFPPPATEETALRLVFLSGDWVPVKLPDRVRRAFTGARVVALGGATEATIWSNSFRVRRVDPTWASIPYGRPIDNARYHVLDRQLSPCPVGVAGDLWIAGGCLSDGYTAAPVQTAGSYRPDPFAAAFGEAAGARMYRTGDRARYRADGNLEFLGRRDHQVKVRGYRIELGEIESVLEELPAVAEAVVLVREDTPGDQRLVAYLEPAGGRDLPPPEELRKAARVKLPEYMVPHAWVRVASWPLSPTGKLDRDVLPAPGETPDGTPSGKTARPAPDGPAAAPAFSHAHTAPRPADGARAMPAASARALLERRIAELWQKVIGVERVGPDDNFFDLGGHSLLMAEVQSGLAPFAGRRVPMIELFRHPTVASLAAALAADERVAANLRDAVAAEPLAAPPVAGRASGAIAVVGMAGRFPGASDLDAFWGMLAEGREGIRRFGREELLAAGVPEERIDDPRFVPARGALDGADLFDAEFFGMTPREAEITDPQQRLFLEASWEALESAAVDPARFAGRVGVFGGTAVSEHAQRVRADRRLLETMGSFQIAIANHPDYLTTRVSYKLGLTGPSLAVHTACSTSLVAVHLAAVSLARGECDLALAGGANARIDEVRGYLHFEGGIDSPDGRTRAFDAAAGGVVNGSGVGVVALKRLEDALAAGDPIRAVILGSAINNDGAAKVGFTAPSEEGQARAVRDALAAAGVSADTIGYIEAHGTGTPLGDPVEVAGLVRAFAPDTDRRGFCRLGSVKTNIGHLDAAAGVAGLIKTVLALERGTVPPSLHFERPNPEIDFEASPFRVAARPEPWPGDGPRRAGVSSFGIGGTNAHAVLEAPPELEPGSDARPAQLLVLSARGEASLGRLAGRLADHFEARPDLDLRGLADAAHTLSVGRRAFAHRRAVVCRSAAEAVDRLRNESRPIAGRVEKQSARSGPPKVVFLFPGQGAQHPGMGSELYAAEPLFRDAIDRAAERLRPEIGCDLRELLFPFEGLPPGTAAGEAAERLARTELTQPALFAVEHALATLWMSWGVAPAAMIGHSLGELTSACLAGVFDLDNALALVAARGRLMAEQPGGDMLAVAADGEEVEGWLAAPEGEGVSLAAVNAPGSCTVSGPAEAVARFAAFLAARKVGTKPVATSHAFHSPAMAPAARAFADRVAAAAPAPPEIPFVSNLTGTWITAEQATDPGYWAEQLLSPVRFADGLATALGDGERLLVEVGPGRTLAGFVRRHPAPAAARALTASLPRPDRGSERGRSSEDGADLDTLLAGLGRLWSEGVEIDWSAYWSGERRRRVPLPATPFEHRSYRAGAGVGDGFVAVSPADRAAALRASLGAGGDGAGAASAAEAGRSPAESPSGGPADENPADDGPAADGAARGPAIAGGLTDTEQGIAAEWTDFLGIEGIGRDDDFFDLGGSSLAGIQLGARLGGRFGVELPAGYLLESSTVGALAEVIDRLRSGDGEAVRPTCLVALQRAAGSDRAPLFLVHQVGGHVYTFRALARELGRDQPLFGLRSRGLEADETPLLTVAEMADHYLELIRAERPRGPYFLGGASMGGAVAFEIARRLTAGGEEVAFLVLMDAPLAEVLESREGAAEAVAAVLQDRTGHRLDLDRLRAEVERNGLEAALDLGLELAREPATEPAMNPAGAEVQAGGIDRAEALRAARVIAANADALHDYRPEPWAGRLLYLRAAERRPGDPQRPELPWIDLARAGAEILVVPGDHQSMHAAPHVAEVAKHLRRALDLRQDRHCRELLAGSRV